MYEAAVSMAVNHGGLHVPLVEFLVAESLDFVGAPFFAAHPGYVPATNQPPMIASIASKLIGRWAYILPRACHAGHFERQFPEH